MAEALEDRKSRGRSPRYPGIDLANAIERAQAIYRSDGKNAVPAEVVLRRWGYTPKSSSGLVALGALRGFGLVEPAGKDVKLSTLALDIILPGSPGRAEAIQRAALTPRIHRDVWDHYAGSLPSNETLKHYLVRDCGFTDSGADEFIKQFRATLSFSTGAESDTLRDENGNGDGDGENTGDDVRVDPKPDLPKPRVERRPGMNQEVFSLTEGEVTLQWPAKLSPRSFKHFKAWLDIIADKVEDASKAEPPAAIVQGPVGDDPEAA